MKIKTQLKNSLNVHMTQMDSWNANMQTFLPHDGRILHFVLHLHSGSEAQTLIPVLSPVVASVLPRASWRVRWGLAFACEESKLGALTAAYLWNSSKTTLILFRLALLEISLSLSLSSGLSVCAAHPLSPVALLSSLLIFSASLNYRVSLSFCCEGDVYVGVRVSRRYLLSGGNIWIQCNLQYLLS